ncbi:MAG TPA: UDP-N-acetylmuramate--L-alanine ligase, partial [Candidatus Babeliaceae bacterium]|nr:UDP-N-acetylmuramate--L-alanine ligase [Candidatus Babeliaceae bacterium]
MYTKKSHIHFVGIGGIGMSGIAKILKTQGYTITGCDSDIEQKSIEELKSLGCSIFEGNNTAYCQDPSTDILVYSSALKPTNSEITAAQQRGIPTIPRALMLSELMRTKYSIAISGAHGKTTTTSLISHILIEAGIDPTVIIGGHLKNISAHARLGTGDFLIAEADESDRSLLRLYPTLAVVTNIDLEHLDVYIDLDDIKATFKQFLNNLPFYGKAFVCIDDPNIQAIMPISHIKTIRYGCHEEADIQARSIELYPDHARFIAWDKASQSSLGTVTLMMPGRHSILNALAAISITRELEIPFDIITQALASFKGIERRFSFKGTYRNAELFDDYGHHPTEIYHTLQVARQRAKNKLIILFQPHRYTRTFHLLQEFAQVFAKASINHLIITDI